MESDTEFLAASDFLSLGFEFSNLKGKKVFVIGVGGGCDIITTYALSEFLSACRPQTLIYANTKRQIEKDLERISPHIYRVPKQVRPLSSFCHTHGSTLIDQSVPRGDEGCPWICHLSRQQEGRTELAQEIENMRFDLIIAVDTGADSIVEKATSREFGRDKMMLETLTGLSCPLLHIVVAPGCDGETSFTDLRNSFERLRLERKYKECFHLSPIMSILRKLSASLEENRTPNIIVAAHEGRLETASKDDVLLIPRGMRPAIPKPWLERAFVFSR